MGSSFKRRWMLKSLMRWEAPRSWGVALISSRRVIPVQNRECKHPLHLFLAALQVNLLIKHFLRSSSAYRTRSLL